MGEWKEMTIEELKSEDTNALATGPFGSTISSKFFTEKGMPVIRGGNLSTNISQRLVEEGLAFISLDKARELKRSTVRIGDLIFTCWGTINQVGFIDGKGSYNEYIISNKQMKFTPNSKITDSLFLYYRFSAPEFQQRILNNNIGSSVPGFNLGQLRNMKLAIPPLPEQKAIASVLSSMDDKIDLLHRQNKTLEGMAEAMFRQWFVEEAEEDWEEVELGGFIKVRHGFAFKGKSISTEKSDQILVTPGNFKIGGGFKFGKMKYYIDNDYSDEYVFKSDDLIVTMTDLSKTGDTLGYSALVPEHDKEKIKYLHNQRVGKVEIKNTIGKYFLYFLMRTREYRWFILGGASGTSIRHTSPNEIYKFSFLLPPVEKLNLFEIEVSPLISKIHKNQIQIKTLASLRDTLLPKLMSGEVRVKL